MDPTGGEEDVREADQVAFADDSAPESRDDGKTVASHAKSKPAQVAVQDVAARSKMPQPRPRGAAGLPPSEQPEPLKGTPCVVVSTQGVYQPLYHEFSGVRELPRIHLFYFDEYTQSPFDVPPTDVDRYLRDKSQFREQKKHKDVDDVAPMVIYCEICGVKIKSLDDHRQSARHVANVPRLDWSGCDAFLDALIREHGER
jgi:hypothetical protein